MHHQMLGMPNLVPADHFHQKRHSPALDVKLTFLASQAIRFRQKIFHYFLTADFIW
jgi:hypothetical protein